MAAGIYIHVPFCVSKCPYCDFYSLPLGDDALCDRYVTAVEDAMRQYTGVKADTLYFGGGTPSLLGGRRLARLTETARRRFSLPADAEITLEANPADDLAETFAAFVAAGGNRVSLGMQSADRRILRALGRRHTPDDLARTVSDARAAGVRSVSLDMMLAVPAQTADHVRRDAETCAALGANHVSAYLLKTEPGTPFFSVRDTLGLPDEDTEAELYLVAVEALEAHGYRQYEISNFAADGQVSRHNLKYWTGEPYLGFGPAAASFFEGARFVYPRDLAGFLNGVPPAPETDTAIAAGSETEYAMLRLRLTDGLGARDFAARFQKPLPSAWLDAARRLPPTLVKTDHDGIRFTPRGFLVSNALIAKILSL